MSAGGAGREALVLSGAGRYADPWHPFAETSAELAAILADAGFRVEVSEDVDARLAALEDVDLLILNIGAPDGSEPDAEAAARRGLLAYLGRGGPILSVHATSTSLSWLPEWEDIEGGLWVRGRTMHPDYGLARIRIRSGAHPIVAGLGDFGTVDERYSRLRVSPGVTVLASHTHDGEEHPLAWAHIRGSARVVYDALGHDAASYAAEGCRRLLARSALWLVGAL